MARKKLTSAHIIWPAMWGPLGVRQGAQEDQRYGKIGLWGVHVEIMEQDVNAAGIIGLGKQTGVTAR